MQRILIIQTASLGDVILASSLVETLHHAYPNTQIDILIKASYISVFESHPYLNSIIGFDKSSGKYKEIKRILKLVRSNHYDAVINIQRFFTSGLITALSGSKIKSGFSSNPWSLFFKYRSKHSMQNVHEIDRNLSLIGFTGITKALMPKLYIPTSRLAAVKPLMTNSYICIAPASLWPTKQYPPDLWASFINQLSDHLDIYLLGTTSDKEIAKEIMKQSRHPRIKDLCGNLHILETAALMKHAQMNFVNDSAPLHITSAVNAPVTAIFCSTIPAFGFGPLSTDAQIAETDQPLPCRPCGIHGKKTCPEKHFQCATTIPVQILIHRITTQKTLKHDC